MEFTFKNRPKWTLPLLAVGLSAGLLGEGLLLLQAQCRRVELELLEDFRVLAFLAPGLPAGQEKVAEERLRALEGIESVRFVSPEDGLRELQESDPDISEAVALLGENPLGGAFEIGLSPGLIADLDSFTEAARAIPELEDLRYKPLQASAILRAQLYRRYLALLLSLAALCWIAAAAWVLARGARFSSAPARRTLLRGLSARPAVCVLGTGLGMGAALLLALPMGQDGGPWPSLWAQLGLLLIGALAGVVFLARERLSLAVESPARERRAPARSRSAREDEELMELSEFLAAEELR